jgi:uncharacterized cupin superfamily protein
VGTLTVGESSYLLPPAAGDAAPTASLWRHEATAPLPYRRAASSEFLYVLEGKARVADSAGNHWDLSAGDMLHVPQGFEGTWETIEDVLKFSVAC